MGRGGRPFGEGILPLKQMVESLRRRDPDTLFCLEMITRGPYSTRLIADG
jgi:hypothetical protein